MTGNPQRNRWTVSWCGCGVRLMAAGIMLAAAGCLQIDTRIKLQQDGSATITERVQLSRRLLDLARMRKDGVDFESYLGKARVLKRVAEMGEGATLVSHEVRNAAQGARECVSVITIPNLNKLRYVSPFLANAAYPKNTVLCFNIAPILKPGGHYGLWPGQLAVRVWPTAGGGSGSIPPAGKPPTTPADLQVYRDLRPVMRDILQGFQVRLVFESYAPIGLAQGYFYYRGQREATREYDLINFSWRDFDRSGNEFLDNEEIMLELLQFDLSGNDLMETIKQHPNNYTVPVYHPNRIPEITFRPSRALFDRDFAGKEITFAREQGGGTRMARFEEIGLQEVNRDAAGKDAADKDTTDEKGAK